MITRQIRDSDAEEVADIIKQCLQENNAEHYPDFIIDHLNETYTPEYIMENAKKQIVLVAEELDEIIATATFARDHFGSIFVRPDHQKRGIGKKLMEALEKLAKKNGIKEVRLHASINAVEFYEKLGYERLGLRKDDVFGTSWEMTKKL